MSKLPNENALTRIETVNICCEYIRSNSLSNIRVINKNTPLRLKELMLMHSIKEVSISKTSGSIFISNL
jgi:hypothetical protein